MARRPWSPRPRKSKILWRKVDTPRYFTHYWSNDTWEANRGTLRTLSTIYGNQFFRRSVMKGDIIYVVTVRGGQLFLGGKLEVGNRTKHNEPLLDKWKEEIRAKPGTATKFDAERSVSQELAERLVILSSRGPVTLPFDKCGLSHHRMRTMRELSASAAGELDRLLE